jgi:hypothetical protein
MRKGPLGLSSVTEKDWVRLAAFIDGEGTILLNRFSVKHRNRKSMWVRVAVVNTDARMVKWIASVFGGPVTSYSRARYNERVIWRWQVSCKQAEQILRGCLEHFIIKKEQAELALQFQDTLGGPGLPVSAETIAFRESLRSKLHEVKSNNGRYDESVYVVPAPQKTGPKPRIKSDNSQLYLIN